jgi:hypothetical protein
MSTNEGVVGTLKEHGMAEVVIQPVTAGIPGASARVNRHVCHCVADGSTITIEALNTVGAEVGDYVSVRRDTSALIKNAAALLGVPLMGILAGMILAALLTAGFSSHMETGMIVMAACLIPGITIGVLIFRRISPGNAPVIEKIIEKGRKGGPPAIDRPFCSVESNRDCSSCGDLQGPF